MQLVEILFRNSKLTFEKAFISSTLVVICQVGIFQDKIAKDLSIDYHIYFEILISNFLNFLFLDIFLGLNSQINALEIFNSKSNFNL